MRDRAINSKEKKIFAFVYLDRYRQVVVQCVCLQNEKPLRSNARTNGSNAFL